MSDGSANGPEGRNPPIPTQPKNDSGDSEASTAAASTLTNEGAPGETIGAYRVLELIGEGGMGEVWLAEQRQPIRRRVALKLIKIGMDTREVVARFESERQALALMDHPTIAKVFDAGSTQRGRPYFAMEYVPGLPITEYCDKHRLSMRERLVLFGLVCQGVQHAHQKAIIHRDLKPSNILVSEVDGKPAPKIIDFGVAKATAQRLTAETMFTRAGSVIGTPEYMSPEQAASAGEDIDTRSDVYSLGVVLYELLVGCLPFDYRKLAFHEVLRRIRDDDAPRPSTKLRMLGDSSTAIANSRDSEPRTLIRELHGDLDSITLKALEKNRSRRYGSPSDLAADIGRYLGNEPVTAGEPSLKYRARKFVLRNKGAVAAAAAVLVVLVLGISATAWQAHTANVERTVAIGEKNEAVARQLAAQAMLLSQESDSNDNLSLLLALESVRRRPLFETNTLLAKLLQVLPQSYELYPSFGEMTGAHVEFSPDGQFVAASQWSKLRLLNVDTRQELFQRKLTDRVRGITFSKDSRSLGFATEHDAEVIATLTGQRLAEFSLKDYIPLGYSPDLSKMLILSADRRATFVFDIAHQAKIAQLETEHAVYGAGFSRDAQQVDTVTRFEAGGKDNWQTEAFDAFSGKEIWKVSIPRPMTPNFLSPDGRLLAVTGQSGVALVNTTTGREIYQLIGRQDIDGRVWVTDFGPDGHRIVIGDNSGAQVFDTSTGKEILRLRQDSPVTVARLSNDNAWLATGNMDGTARVFEVATGRETVRAHLMDDVREVQFSPNSRWVAFASIDGAARVMEAGIGVMTPDGPIGLQNNIAAFSSDGELFASGTSNDALRVVQSSSGKELWSLKLDSPVRVVAFSPDRQKIAAGADGGVTIFDISGKEIWRLHPEGRINTLTFSPDNDCLAIGTDKITSVFDGPSGKDLWLLHRDTKAVAFTPDGKRIAAGNNAGNIRVFDAKTGKDVPGAARFSWAADRLAFSPDGRWRVDSFPDMENENGSSVRLIEVASGNDVWHIQLHNPVTAVAFSPDSRWLAIGSRDGTQQIFSVQTHAEVARIVHAGIPAALAFDPGTRYLNAAVEVSGTAAPVLTSPVRKFQLYHQFFKSEDLVREACSRLPSNLTHAQWEQYLPNEPYQKSCPDLPIPHR